MLSKIFLAMRPCSGYYEYMIKQFFLSVGLTVACSLSLMAQDYPTDCINIKKVEGTENRILQTPIATYVSPDGQVVDLVGAIHIGERDYFEQLNELFTGYDRVLYEMVDGATLSRMMTLRKKFKDGSITEEESKELATMEDKKSKGSIFGVLLSIGYALNSNKMGLVMQQEVVDYGFEHFVFADMTMEEMDAAMKERKETFLGMVLTELLPSRRSKDSSKQTDMAKKLLTGEATEGMLRGVVMDTLAEKGTKALDETAIIVSRNEKAMKVLIDELKNKDSKKLAIFYGAAHLPDFHKRLLALGFTFQKVDWIDAFGTEEESSEEE